MRLDQSFLRLPRRFCADTLAAEARALPESAWMPHPGNIAGNDAVPLVSPGGEATNKVAGAMAPTAHLRACPYIMQVMAELGGVWGRSRLMGLAPGAEVPPHVDVNYYWRTHWRIHIPVITSPGVLFTCGDETVHMAAGECWLFDSFRPHRVHNGGTAKRIHLVLDTVGSERFSDLLEEAQQATSGSTEPPLLAPCEGQGGELAFENFNAPKIMSPWEIRCHLAFLAGHLLPHPRAGAALRRLDRFVDGWAAAWAQHGEDEAGLADYSALIASARTDLARIGAQEIRLDNEVPLLRALGELVFSMAVPKGDAGVTAAATARPGRPALERRAG